jgi:hypothetical protein
MPAPRLLCRHGWNRLIGLALLALAACSSTATAPSEVAADGGVVANDVDAALDGQAEPDAASPAEDGDASVDALLDGAGDPSDAGTADAAAAETSGPDAPVSDVAHADATAAADSTVDGQGVGGESGDTSDVGNDDAVLADTLGDTAAATADTLGDTGAAMADTLGDTGAATADTLGDGVGDSQTTADAAPVAVLVCPKVSPPVSKGLIVSFKVNEGSGLAASQLNAGTLWVHNDSGASNQIVAISTTGVEQASFKLDGAKAVDWEDIAIGPGPAPQTPYIYVGDIGDNGESRSGITVYRVAEPKVTASLLETTLKGVEALPLVYPDKPHNAETLMVDPLSGDLYIVVKDGGGVSPVFRAAAPLVAGQKVTLQQVAQLQFGQAPLGGSKTTTAGDISPDGKWIAVRTYDAAFLWLRQAGMTVGQALAGAPCPIPQAKEGQGEALGFAADGKGYYTFSEGKFVPLSFYAIP